MVSWTWVNNSRVDEKWSDSGQTIKALSTAVAYRSDMGYE